MLRILRLSLCLLLSMALMPMEGAAALSGTEITFLKIGKADAILVTTASHALLIDAGEEDDGKTILKLLERRRIQALDAVIITHFDKDHVGGAAEVLEGIPVLAVYDASYESESDEYRAYTGAIEAMATPRVRVTEQQTLTLGALRITLMPSQLETESDNDNSLVVSIDDGFNRFFFAADAEEARIEALLQQSLAPHDLVKMPHHGRMKGNLKALLEALSPQYAIITDSDKNPADDETLALLKALGIATYETRDGDIRAISGQAGVDIVQ